MQNEITSETTTTATTPLNSFIQRLARMAVRRSEPAYEWLGTIPLPAALLEVSDALCDLHRIAEDPTQWLAIHNERVAPIAMHHLLVEVDRLVAAHRAATQIA
jgi:hypothetical protein